MWADFNEIEKLAFESQPLPIYHAQSEQIAYLSMRCVYHDYRLGYLDKEQAQKERGQIKHAYLEQSKKEKLLLSRVRQFDNLRVAMGKVNKDIELHGCELCKKMVRVIDGRLSLNENKKE